MTTTSDALRTIAARLCLREETQLDGRMLLARVEEVARLESELAEIHEAAGDVCMALNDQLNSLTALVGKLTKRPTLPVDGGMKCPHCKSVILWSEDRGAHCDGCDEFDPETDAP